MTRDRSSDTNAAEREQIETIAEAMGAEVVGRVPDARGGAFDVALLGEVLRRRLEPGAGKRPGRPSNREWSQRSKVPLSAETKERLRELAEEWSDERRKVSPMQVAAHLLEEAVRLAASRPRRTKHR